MGFAGTNFDADDVLNAYDCYIQAANEADAFSTGWRPVCVAEFMDNEYRNVWLRYNESGNPFDEMFDGYY